MPMAMIVPRAGLSLAESGRTMPPAVFVLRFFAFDDDVVAEGLQRDLGFATWLYLVAVAAMLVSS